MAQFRRRQAPISKPRQPALKLPRGIPSEAIGPHAPALPATLRPRKNDACQSRVVAYGAR